MVCMRAMLSAQRHTLAPRTTASRASLLFGGFGRVIAVLFCISFPPSGKCALLRTCSLLLDAFRAISTKFNHFLPSLCLEQHCVLRHSDTSRARIRPRLLNIYFTCNYIFPSLVAAKMGKYFVSIRRGSREN